MKKEIIVTASSIDEAIDEAIKELGVQRDAVEVEVIEESSKKFFGEATAAKVKVSLRNDTIDDEFEKDADDGTEARAEMKKGNWDAEEGVEEMDEAESVVIGDAEAEVDEPSSEILSDGNQADGEAEDLEEESDEDGDLDFSGEDEKNFNELPIQLSDEELDIIADTAIETIREFLAYFNIEDASIDEYEGEEGELILDIVGDNLAVLIGRHGKTLDSFQFLVSAIVGKKTGYRHPVIVDVEGYKHRRKQKLVSIAKSSAARVIRQKREVNLRPMSPYERRIIHVALKNDKRVVTSSEGAEPGRYVVIRLA
jgi:spoIIIJ-associated protein